MSAGMHWWGHVGVHLCMYVSACVCVGESMSMYACQETTQGGPEFHQSTRSLEDQSLHGSLHSFLSSHPSAYHPGARPCGNNFRNNKA